MGTNNKWLRRLGYSLEAWGIILQPFLGVDVVGLTIGYLENVVTQILVPVLLGAVFMIWGGWEWVSDKWDKLGVGIRRTAAVVVVVFILFWAGLPRLQGALLGKKAGVLIEERWMSEAETESYITNKLLRETNNNVFPWRVRMLMWNQSARRKLSARWRCEGDSIWNQLCADSVTNTIFDWSQFDGSISISEETGCKIEYWTEAVYRWPWIKVEEQISITKPNLQK